MYSVFKELLLAKKYGDISIQEILETAHFSHRVFPPLQKEKRCPSKRFLFDFRRCFRALSEKKKTMIPPRP